MPKEQGNPGERLARSSSKTAKDKTNSATLQASQGGGRREQSGTGDKNNRVRHVDSEKDSEKDSGYSGKRLMQVGLIEGPWAKYVLWPDSD